MLFVMCLMVVLIGNVWWWLEISRCNGLILYLIMMNIVWFWLGGILISVEEVCFGVWCFGLLCWVILLW